MSSVQVFILHWKLKWTVIYKESAALNVLVGKSSSQIDLGIILYQALPEDPIRCMVLSNKSKINSNSWVPQILRP